MATNRDTTTHPGVTEYYAPTGTTGSTGIPPATERAGEPGGIPNSGTTAGLGRTEEAKAVPKSAPETGAYGTTGREERFTPSNAHGETVGASIGKTVRGGFVQAHGIGESIRGNFLGALDSLAGSKEGEAKNAEIANRGEREFTNKEFERSHNGRHV